MAADNSESITKKKQQNVDDDERVPLLRKIQDQESGLDEVSRASFHGSMFNLSCTIIGSGIMSLPATLKITGVIPGFALIIFAALLTETSIELLLKFSKPGPSFSYGDAMDEAFGPTGRILVQASVVINNTGGLIVYMIIIADVLSGAASSRVQHVGVLDGWFGEQWWTGRAFVLVLVTIVIIIPLISFKRIDSLRFTSLTSIALAVVFLLIVLGITICKSIVGSIQRPALFPRITNIASVWKLFTAVPVVVFSYICHHNAHTIENELDTSSKRMQAVVQASLVLCTIVYLMTGLFGLLLFGDSTFHDILSNFDTDLGIPYSSVFNDIVRISYAGHIILVFPIIFFPSRLNLDGLLHPKAIPLALDNLRFSSISAGLILVILSGAIFTPSIWTAFQFIGATTGILLGFIFPAAVALKDPHGIATRKDKIISIIMVILAVFSNIIAIYSNAISLLT